MACVYKDYEVKMKMIQQQWMKLLLGYNMKIAIQ